MGGGPIGLFKVIRFCKNRREVNDERQVADAGSLRDAGGGSGAEHSGLDVSHASIRGIMRQRLYAWHESV
jgi:hypothetical protein